jgi:hypothetical protein
LQEAVAVAVEMWALELLEVQRLAAVRVHSKEQDQTEL